MVAAYVKVTAGKVLRTYSGSIMDDILQAPSSIDVDFSTSDAGKENQQEEKAEDRNKEERKKKE